MDHPTSHIKQMQSRNGMNYFAATTRPLSIRVANQIMSAGFLLLNAMKSNPPDIDLLRQAEAKVQDAFRSWKTTVYKGRKARNDARRKQQSARVENPGS